MTADRQKIMHAVGALATVIISGAFVLTPLFSNFDRAMQKGAGFQDRMATIRLLEARLQAEREALADAGTVKGVSATAIDPAPEEAGQRPLLRAVCSRISERLSRSQIELSAPCTEARRSLDDRFVFHTVELAATGPLAPILSALDDVLPGTQIIEHLDISGADHHGSPRHGTVRVRLASIIRTKGDAQR